MALNKRLIQATLKPNKKLLFTSVHLTSLPPSENLKIRLESNLGTRLFRSSIHSDGTHLGKIVFYGQ